MNSKIAILVVVLVIAVAGVLYWQNGQAPSVSPTPTPSATVSSTEYRNTQYGFSVALPDSWKGYTVLNSQWEGRDVATNKVTVQGPIVTIRHPLWTTSNPREDMPVMIFTPAQWALVQSEKMAVSAAPIPPSVLGQNSKYVIALPARYNYDFKTGFEEVDQLVHTLKVFEPIATTTNNFCGGIAAIQCPSGYSCKLDGSYPDAGGTCIPNGSTGTLTGHVTIGPNCPVEQAGNPCTPSPQAYTSRQVMVYKADGTTLVATQNFDTQGNYDIALSPGIYVVKARTNISSTANVVGTVTIKSGQISTLNFSIDTGIR